MQLSFLRRPDELNECLHLSNQAESTAGALSVPYRADSVPGFLGQNSASYYLSPRVLFYRKEGVCTMTLSWGPLIYDECHLERLEKVKLWGVMVLPCPVGLEDVFNWRLLGRMLSL